jgi:hypothetical protein
MAHSLVANLSKSGHKKVHSLKFQILTTPDGLILSIIGPFEGCRHDSRMLRESNLLVLLRQFCHDGAGAHYYAFADLGYFITPHIIIPYNGMLLLFSTQFHLYTRCSYGCATTFQHRDESSTYYC